MNIQWNYIRITEQLEQGNPHIQMGLREDGVVVWRKLFRHPITGRYEPEEFQKEGDHD